MTQYNSLNVKLSNSQLNKIRCAIKNEAEVALRLSSNTIGDNQTSFPHKLLLTNRQVENLRANYLSTDIKLSKTQLSKMIQSGAFLGRLLGPLLKTGLPLIKTVINPLAKSILIPLILTAVASTADAGTHKKFLGSGHNHPSSRTLIISNDEIEDIIKIVKSLEDSGLSIKPGTETVQNEVKTQKGGFLIMLLGTLGASLLGNILSGKGAMATSQGRGIYRAGKGRGINRAGKGAIAKSVSEEMKWKRQGWRIVRAGYVRRSSKIDF